MLIFSFVYMYGKCNLYRYFAEEIFLHTCLEFSWGLLINIYSTQWRLLRAKEIEENSKIDGEILIETLSHARIMYKSKKPMQWNLSTTICCGLRRNIVITEVVILKEGITISNHILKIC